jgi:hypothetical protein
MEADAKYDYPTMKQSIIDLITQHKCIYVEIDTENDLKLIYDCLINDRIDDATYNHQNGTVLLYYGFYYRYINTNPELMKKYYLMGIEKNNVYCEYNFANWCKKYGDIDRMKKYYRMASKKNYIPAICNFALWYEENGDYDNMTKYYLKGAKNGDTNCCDLMNKYFERSFDVKNMCLAYSFLKQKKIKQNHYRCEKYQ